MNVATRRQIVVNSGFPMLLVVLVVPVLLVTACRPGSATEAEMIERSRLVASYEQLLRQQDAGWVRTVGRGMGTVLALRVAPGAHDTARTGLALILDDVLNRSDEDGIKALTVLLESDGLPADGPEPYLSTWFSDNWVHRELRGRPPEEILEDLHMEELVFTVAGSQDNRRITLQLYYAQDDLTALLQDRRREAGLPPARR